MSEPYLSRWRLRRDGPSIRTPHARLWPVLSTKHTNYAQYQEKTSREIPLVLLTQR